MGYCGHRFPWSLRGVGVRCVCQLPLSISDQRQDLRGSGGRRRGGGRRVEVLAVVKI